MHEITFKLLRHVTDNIRKTIDERVPVLAFPIAVAVAQAEALLEAHERAAAPLPSRWASVHSIDCTGATGVVTALQGGYRIHWHDSDVAADCEVPVVRIRDIFAVHSIDWLTEAEYLAHVAQVGATCQDRAKEHMRRRTWPEDYRLVKRISTSSCPYGIQRKSDGLVAGYWSDCTRPLSHAWQCQDGDESEVGDFRPSIEPIENCAEMPIPF